MKHQYESEILYHLMERDGFNIPSSVPPYEAEIKAYLINQVKQAYPKLTDYEAEWLLYNYTKHLPADFPVYSVTNVTNATFENVVPYAYQSAILKGSTKYRDIDTGEVLDAFDNGRNLELVSVKMPVLTTTGKNLFDGKLEMGSIDNATGLDKSSSTRMRSNYIKVKPSTTYTLSSNESTYHLYVSEYDANKSFIKYISNKNNIAFTTNSTTNYIRFRTDDNETDFNIEIQLEDSSIKTSYEPYKTNILTTNEEVELRGIGDVQDTLDCLTGDLTQRIGTDELNGTESWTWKGFNTDISFAVKMSSPIKNIKSGSKLLLDKFNYGVGNSFSTITFREMDGTIGVYLPKNTIDDWENDWENKLPEFLSKNNINFKYELASESIKTVDLKCTDQNGKECYFMPLEGTMHVSTSGNPISPKLDMSVPVEATTQNLASFIDLEVEGE